MSYGWNKKLDRSYGHREAYAFVEVEARALLAKYHWQRPAGVSTNELAEALIGDELITSEARKRLYKALAALSTRGLSDCVTKGEPVQRQFGMIRPNLWHKPTQATVCVGCGRPL